MSGKLKQGTWSLALLAGDIVILYVSLWLGLLLRYMGKPEDGMFREHFLPFSFLFVFWLLVFYIADLYGRSFYLRKTNLFLTLLKSQVANSLIAIIFFYTLTFYRITPKTLLLINLVVSFVLLFAWRWLVQYFFKFTSKTELIIIGCGKEFDEMAEELEQNERYGFKVMEKINSCDFDNNFAEIKKRLDASIGSRKEVVLTVESFANLSPQAVGYLYELMFRGVEFIDFQQLYENIFEYVPLSFVNNEWLLGNISSGKKNFYDLPKRIIDIVFSFICGIVSLVFYPFIILAIKLDDQGPIFFINERVGENNRRFKQLKFRTMHVGVDVHWPEKGDKRITRVGSFMRELRIDELPQLWNVFWGDMSFVGPRPDIINFFQICEEKIPCYNIRSLIKPGLTGWAQIQQIAPVSVEETQKRLAYDIYYIKNRSFFLDIKIVLHTLRIILSKSGI